MAYRDIRIIGDPILRTECDWITDIDRLEQVLNEGLTESSMSVIQSHVGAQDRVADDADVTVWPSGGHPPMTGATRSYSTHLVICCSPSHQRHPEQAT